jgi:phospholipase C
MTLPTYRSRASAFAAAATLAALTACSAGGQVTPAPPTQLSEPSSGSHVPFTLAAPFLKRHLSGKIQHVVIIVQENRSFDDLFNGYPGANTVTSGKNSKGQTIQLQPVGLETQYVIDHSADAMFSACNGTRGRNCKMNGFDKEQSFGGPANPEYVYVPQSETGPYFALANEFVLADNNFQSHLDESFVSHQYLIAAQAASSVNLPLGEWGCDGGPSDTIQTLKQDRTYGSSIQACYDYTTLADELDSAGLTWRFYTSTLTGDGGYWSAFQAVKHIRDGPDWSQDVITPQTQFFQDVKGGNLANVTWITPTCENSDHVNCGGKTGPHWVGTLVNAIGRSQFWDTTAVFVVWDDWGGTYDHVAPPYEDYDGNGFRVGMLMISPYAKQGSVTHTQYESVSILKFIEDQYGLPQMAAADARAADPANDPAAFDFTQQPRKYKKVKTDYDEAFFLNQPYDARPPDEQ